MSAFGLIFPKSNAGKGARAQSNLNVIIEFKEFINIFY